MNTRIRASSSSLAAVIGLTVSISLAVCTALSLSTQSSLFCGRNLITSCLRQGSSSRTRTTSIITMRKQKASNKRTRRLQREGKNGIDELSTLSSIASSPLTTPIVSNSWNYKSLSSRPIQTSANTNERGRGRSRKRSLFYNSLSSYHSHFLKLITDEFLAEENTVRQRLEVSADDPLSLEIAGHALFDLYPERRGNIFSDEVYRLVKAFDATSTYSSPSSKDGNVATEGNNNSQYIAKKRVESSNTSVLPPNHKFSQNDVIMLTLQPGGTGDYFDRKTIPTNTDKAISVEARVLNTGPTYVDVAVPGGLFEAKFGPAPNNNSPSGKGNPKMRLRVDRFFSNIPYKRMVGALSQLTPVDNRSSNTNYVDGSIRQIILATFAYSDPSSPSFGDAEACNLQELSKLVAKAPLKDSTKLTNEVLNFLQSDHPQNLSPRFNGPQLSSIGAALTRKLTMIQGPPGTGKTTVAASIAFGFVHQCRSLSPNHKVLASAFSNCGADNLAEQLLRTGLKVVRVGKASAVSPLLWDYTLDAAIERDADAKKAMEEAMVATSNLRQQGGKNTRGKAASAMERNRRDVATRAVKASSEACNAAATKAMREADVIVCTSIGAADTRLLAACGILADDDDSVTQKSRQGQTDFERKQMAPDGRTPLKIPFVLIDEACQSVEPATLIPILSTNSCRSLVMLGDPCQLPPTVISDSSGQGDSPLSLSLMSRLASTLPAPVVVTSKADKTPKESDFLNLKATRQAVSLVKYRSENSEGNSVSYRKKFAGSLLLTVQYRMHPSIAAFSSSVFYDGLLSTPAFLSKPRNLPRDFADVLPIEGRSVGVRFVSIEGRNNEKRGDSTSSFQISSPEDSPSTDARITNESISNGAEASQIIAFLKQVMETGEDSDSPFEGSIGIITPYSAQVALIKSMMTQDTDFTALIRGKNVSVEVNSVDAYQGRERDIIIFSAVRSNRRDNVGFLSDWRRMNVALTRAKSGLIVFGDMSTLKGGDKHWEAFCIWADDMGCVFDIDDDHSDSNEA